MVFFEFMVNDVCRFVDLDTPLLLSEDPVCGGYEGIDILFILTISL